MDNKVSIYDIAKYLGVSPATVSYVINGVNKVSDKTKEKVLKAIDELGYVPNYTARALSTGKSHLIGILLPLEDPSIAFLQNPFYAEFIGGLEKGISKYNYDVVIGVIKNQTDFKDWIRSRDLDGLVMIGSYDKEIYKDLNGLNIPIVLTDDYSDLASSFNSVRSNDEAGIYSATKYLIDNGHRDIAFVGNPKAYLIDNYRYNGYKKALDDNNIRSDYLYKTDATFDSGYLIGEDIIKDKKVSAIICSGDMLAIGIIKKIKELGYDVPKDLSIIGFDDIASASIVHPGLTTIHQDIGEKGYRSAQIIIDILENDRKGKIAVNLEPYLVKRDTVIKK